MSSQQQQRVRRMASPSTKSGPMKATLTFGLQRQGSPNQALARSSNGRKISPASSPTPQWGAESHRKNRRSPDNRLSPDRAASSSPAVKEKQKILRPSPVYHHTKRTASYDTITPYLKGEWPKECALLPIPQPPQTSDQATQTEEWEDQLSAADRKKKTLTPTTTPPAVATTSHKRSSSAGNSDSSSKEVRNNIRARLARTSKESTRTGAGNNVRTSPVQGKHLASNAAVQTKAMAMPLVVKPTIRIRNSVEGPSQEIEKLVSKQTSGPEDMMYLPVTQEMLQDGHRAPVRDLLAAGTRTVDTQTPSEPDMRLIEEDRSSSSSASDSPSSLPIIPGVMDSPRPSSRSDSSDSKEDKARDLLFHREPPDGCERVRTVEEPSIPVMEFEALKCCPIQIPPEKCIIPSEGSAFLPLFKPYVNQPSKMALGAADPPL